MNDFKTSEEQRTRRKKYYHEHREQERTKGVRYYHQHKEERLAYRKKRSNVGAEKEASRKYYLKHREEILKRKREYRQTHHKEVLEKSRERHAKDREKDRVRTRAKDYIPLAPLCQICGTTENLERHHPDYDKPLEIVTLCRSCHMRIHH